MVSPDSRAYRARRQAETPLIVLFRFPEPALFRMTAIIVNAKHDPAATVIGQSTKMFCKFGFIFGIRQIHPRFIFDVGFFRPMVNKASQTIQVWGI
jgi:hypothetical protein